MADYYVSAAGDDTNDGSLAHPWKTITRVNTAFTAGLGLKNRVLFRRGDTFYGALRPPTNLNPAYPGWLRIGAYGTGSQPIICGYKLLTIGSGWVQHDANTWKIDYSAGNSGITYTGYDSAQGTGDVGFLKVDGVIYGANRYTLGELVDQWDYYSDGTTLYVRSSAKPTDIATDIRCTLDRDGVRVVSGIEIADLAFIGFGACGVNIITAAQRNRLLRCTIAEIGGAYLDTRRYGNGVQVFTNSSDIYCEYNVVRDVYDTAWSIQGGSSGQPSTFTNITWRRNLTYRCGQAEEYWYSGTGNGFVNCVSEYNTNLFSGYGWGAEYRPDPNVRVALLSYGWGNPNDHIADLTLRRNIFYDSREAYSYHAYSPTGLDSDRNLIFLRPGTKMRFQNSQTVEQATAWSAVSGREQNSSINILPASGDASISDGDVSDAIANLNQLAKTGQRVNGKVVSIHAPWQSI